PHLQHDPDAVFNRHRRVLSMLRRQYLPAPRLAWRPQPNKSLSLRERAARNARRGFEIQPRRDHWLSPTSPRHSPATPAPADKRHRLLRALRYRLDPRAEANQRTRENLRFLTKNPFLRTPEPQIPG